MRGKAVSKSETMILVKVHIASSRKIVAVCDSELLGKKFEENGLQIDLTGSFYKGEEADEEKVELMLKHAYVADFVGKDSVKLGIKSGLVEEANVSVVKGVPRAQYFAI